MLKAVFVFGLVLLCVSFFSVAFAQESSDVSGVFDTVKGALGKAKSIALPMEVQNMQKEHDTIKGDLVKLEKDDVKGNPSISRIEFLRIALHFHLKHLIAGGQINPSSVNKTHPAVIAMKQEYPDLDNRLRKLESKYLECTFAYKMPDGAMIRPDVNWTEEELKNTENTCEHGVARCWLDKDPKSYY